MNPTNKIIEEVLEEFDKMTDDIPSENNSLYDEGGVDEWLKNNSDKHLYENSVYGEPMLDLSQSKISIFLKDSLLRVQESVLEEVREKIEGMKKYGEDNGISSNFKTNWQRQLLKNYVESYNQALDDVSKELKKK